MNAQATTLPGLTAEELDLARLPLKDAYTMPPAAYTSPALYDLEVQRIMRKNWLPVARVDQISNPGDYLTLDLFGQPLMAVHGADGEIRVMSRVCLHRAAPLIEGSGKKKLFTCPYHAWSYDTSGQLIRAPLMDGCEGFDPNSCKLPQIRTEIWEGFVLANLDPEAAPFAPQVTGFQSYFEKFRLSEMVVVRVLEFESGWNWKVLVENFMEAYHHIATHSKTFEPGYHARDSKILDNDGPWSILHMPSAYEETPPGLPLVPGLEDWQKRDLFAGVIFPHFLLGVQGSGAAWYQVLPESAGKLTLKIHLMTPRASTHIEDFDEMAGQMEQMISTIHHEDIGANDLVWRGLNAPLTRQGRLSQLEKSIWQLNQWWLDRMEGASS